MPQLTCLLTTFYILFCCVCSENITDTRPTKLVATSAASTTIVGTDHNNGEFQSPIFRENSVEDSKYPINVVVGERIRLTCSVRGKPKPVVHFLKNSQPLKTQEASLTYNRIEVTASSVRISKAQLEDSGVYRCDAINSIGSRSLTFKVNVSISQDSKSGRRPVQKTLAPYWTNERKMKKKLHAEPAGNTVLFRCLADGEKPLTAKWYKDDKEIYDKAQRIGGFKFRHKSQLIVLESVVLSDRGLYMCVISNAYGSINHTYELDVAERSAAKPILEGGLLENQTVTVGSDVTFQCRVISDAHPHVQWLKINSGNTSDISVLKKAGVNTTNEEMRTLVLKNVSYDDAGEYTCLAGNAIGISHISAWLTVLPEMPSDPPMTVQETHYLIYLFGGICVLIVAVFVIYLTRSRYTDKDVPRLVPIDNPDNIPPMTKMEEPLMLIGNEQAWRRMMHADHIEINIQPDLQWELKREDIHLHDRIDEGFFGQVFRADLIRCTNGRKDKADAAVKMLKPSRTEKDMLDLLTEMDQMKRVGKHKNIINLLGVCTQNGGLWLVTEYAQQGNLRDYLRRNRPANMQYHLIDPNSAHVPTPRSEPLSQKDLVSAAYQVARGMDYLAQKKCIHRDLAARNVLVSDEYVMKIADFGLARDIRSNDYYRKQTRGHLPYKWMALEAMMDNIFTHATDVWSFGVLLWEIFSLGGSPYPGVKTHELVRFLRQGERLEFPQFSSLELYRLMRDCWDELPQKRPRFRQLVEDLDRMLAESSAADYIDLSLPLAADYSSSCSEEESGIDDEVESSRDSANATGEDSDSVFEHNGGDNHSIPSGEHQFDEGEEGPLLRNHTEVNIMCNGHARLQSDALQ